MRELGFKKIYGSTVYKWNVASQRLHESLGFEIVGEDEQEFKYELPLQASNLVSALREKY